MEEHNIMKKHAGKLLGVLLIVMIALAGCGTKNAGTADGSSAAAETTQDSVKSKVKFDGVYTAGDTLKIQMTLDKDGNCDYGYTGIYQLSTSDAGYRVLNLIYYGQDGYDDAQTQLAYDSYGLEQNADGTYTRCKITEGEEPDFLNGGTILKFESGSDTIFTDNTLEAEYTSNGGSYIELHEDGTFVFGVHMKYAADKEKFELIGGNSSSVYTYEADENQDSLVLKNSDGQTVMDLQRKEN